MKTIKEHYDNLQQIAKNVESAKQALKDLESEFRAANQDMMELIYSKRDSKNFQYGKIIFESGGDVFQFNFSGKTGAMTGIEDFKKVTYKNID